MLDATKPTVNSGSWGDPYSSHRQETRPATISSLPMGRWR